MPALKTERPAQADNSEAEFTVQETAARTGLSEHTLRYYERAGLLRSIRRQDSSGHRRYSAEDVSRIATLACLRATGMPLDQMRRYFELAGQGKWSAPALKSLLETQREVLVERLAQMRWHLAYVEQKIAWCAAVESGDEEAVAGIVRDLERRIRDQGRKANRKRQQEEES